MSDAAFEPLAAALEGYFDKPLRQLPNKLRARVGKREFFGLAWDRLSPRKRQAIAVQWDNLHDPAAVARIKRADDFGYESAKAEVTKWRTVPAPTASDQAVKDDRLKAAQASFDQLDTQHKRERGDYPDESGSGPAAKKKRTRTDAVDEAIEEAIRLARDEHGDAPTPRRIMASLMTLAGRPGSGIARVTPTGVEWLDEAGEKHPLDVDALRKRLRRREERLAKRPPTST